MKERIPKYSENILFLAFRSILINYYEFIREYTRKYQDININIRKAIAIDEFVINSMLCKISKIILVSNN